jgi:DNA-binding beta-propeller fold protein YncE
MGSVIFPVVNSLANVSLRSASNSSFTSNQSYIDKWSSQSKRVPDNEYLVDFRPIHLTAHRNYLFCYDDKLTLSIFSTSTSIDFKFVRNYLVGIPGVKGIGVNSEYVAYTYSCVKREQQAAKILKKLHTCGVILFRRQTDTVCSMYDKVIEFTKSSVCFKSPKGIALDETNIFVCDRDLHKVFKFDIKTSNLLQEVEISDGIPYGISVNSNFIAVTDIAKNRIITFDVETFTKLNSLKIEDRNGKNGPYNIVVSRDNLIFIKNYSDSEIVLLDSNLNVKCVFEKLPDKVNISGIALLETTNQILFLGAGLVKKDYKLIRYTV